MTTATAITVWCGRCGKLARYHHRSVDPRYPVVECGVALDNGAHTGCGIIAGIIDGERAEDIRVARHRVNLSRQHHFHVKRGGPVTDCPRCEADPPPYRDKAARCA